ncbi:TPA: motility associated factor glycosyltransferase family protein, partial [Campylobacter jejuni]
MKFNQNQIKLFNRNINALNNTVLKESLKQIKSSKFELILGKDNLDINLKNTNDNTFLYENVINELNSMLNTYNDKYLLYPVLYFYGFGNGILFKALLQNKNHQHIVVFEKDIEIIWTMFHILDFSNELQNSRLMILETNSLDIEFFSDFCSSKPFFQFSRIYFLELMSNYYERYNEDVLKFNNNILSAFKLNILRYGNDPLDALQGIEQFVYNLPQMITHPSYTELLSKRKNLSDTAIIVSTGPSLTKQLPLLKQYANKATIFCADSAYPILAKHNIKPDYVCMLERDDIVSKCFDNDFKEFDKGILFILASVVHKEVIEFLERNNREYMLVHRPLHFAASLNLKEFGYIGVGASVANMAYELAASLRHENIIFIGQDLAYAEDGSSHPSEHIYGNKGEKIRGEVYALAYGGEKQVRTQLTWNLFRQAFEKDIFWAKEKLKINTYNCTEGGARIEGTIEKPFKGTCETLLKENLKKPFDKPKILENNETKNKFLQTQKLLIKNVEQSEKFIKKCQNELKKLDFELGKSQLNLQALIKIKQNLLIFF